MISSNKKAKALFLALVIASVILAYFAFAPKTSAPQNTENFSDNLNEPPQKEVFTDADTQLEEKESNTKIPPQTEYAKLPESFVLDVPFTSQAPPVYGIFGNKPLWDADHEDACEEASIIMAHFYNLKKPLAPQTADQEILKMLDYQENNWQGRHTNLNAEKIAELAEKFYGYKNVEVHYDIKIADVKNQLFSRNPVILPAAGRILGNPNFTGEGPPYHALVAIGWENGNIITNDPGTKNGERYSYTEDVLYHAVHDWNESDILKGKKAMIVLK